MANKEYEQLPEGVMNAALSQLGQKPTYAGTYDQQIQDMYDRIVNRQPFKYNAKEDPLYQSYKDQYVQQGKLAMKDTMGQAAALTGGYGSTYGQSVGQQTYDAYLQNLSAVIPELYGKAYDKYKAEGDDLMTQYGMLGQQRDTEYGRYRDELGDWENEREYQRQLENEEYNRSWAENEREYQRQQDLGKQQQQAYSNLYAIIAASGYVPTDEELAAAGMTREAADAIRAEYQRNIDMQNEQIALQRESLYARGGSGGSGVGGGGGGSGGGGGGGGGYYGSGGSDIDYSDYEKIYTTIEKQRKAADNYEKSNPGTSASSALENLLKRAADNGGKVKTTR